MAIIPIMLSFRPGERGDTSSRGAISALRDIRSRIMIAIK